MPNSKYDILAKELEEWNPMQEHFTNSDFNKYESGPGAAINKADIPFLVFRNLPNGTNKHILKRICERHGSVLDVRDSSKCKTFFADCASVADMEAILQALEKNTYGFSVEIGKRKTKTANIVKSYDYHPEQPKKFLKEINKEERLIYVPDKKPARAKIDSMSFPKREDYEKEGCLLQKNDPQRQLLNVTSDAHELEMKSILNPKVNLGKIKNSMKYFRNGRAYIRVPEGIDGYMKAKYGECRGEHNDKNEFVVKSTEVTEDSIGLGKCSVCKVICNLACSRCSTYFCSLECQVKSWPKHRLNCGKPDDFNLSTYQTSFSEKDNKSVDNSKSYTSSCLIKNFPESESIVELTSVNKTNVVFLRSKTNEANLTYFKTVTDVENVAKNLKPCNGAPKCGEIVLTKFEGKYNRAIVIGISDPNQARVNFIDYGNVDIKAFKDLYKAPESLIRLPRLAQPVILKDVPDCYMTDEIRSYMYSYLTEDLIIKYCPENDYIKEKGVYMVELYDVELKQSFNENIIQLTKTLPPVHEYEVYHIRNLDVVPLPVGENIKLVVMDNSILNTGCISCAEKDCAIQIQKFQNDIQRYANSIPPTCYAPRIDELCIVQYDGDKMWYRGRCLELVGDGFPTISLIDYGNMACVDVNYIRRFPKQFAFPIFTHDCEVEGLPIEIDDKLLSRAEELIPSCTLIHCDKVEKDEKLDIYSIKLNEILDKLKAEGLVKDEEK